MKLKKTLWVIKSGNEIIITDFEKDIVFEYNKYNETNIKKMFCEIKKESVSEFEVTNDIEEGNIMEFFKQNNWLDYTGDVSNEMSRNKFFMDAMNIEYDLKKIEKHNICIVGCGGIGNNILFQLTSFGFKNFEIYDEDKIELSNLNRQFMFSQKDVGKYKTKVIKEYLERRFSNISIKTNEFFLNKDTIQSFNTKFDLVIFSGDSGVKDINIAFKYFECPIVNIGYTKNSISYEIIKEEINENYEVLYRGKSPSSIINNSLVTSKFVLNYIKNIDDVSKMENYFEKI